MAANRDSYFPDWNEGNVHMPDIGFEPHSTVNVPTPEETTESSGHTRMTPRPGTKRKTSNSSKNGRIRRTGTRSSGDRIRNHQNSSQTTNRSATNREIEARRRKEKIRRRKRKHNRCAMLEKLIERLEHQPEVESHSLLGVTCRDVSYFVILFAVVLFLRSAISLYTQSVLEQIQLRYILANSQLDLIKGTESMGFIVTVIVVGFFGRRCHKPLLMTCGVCVLALGAIIWPVPYFVTSTAKINMTNSYSCSAKPNPFGLDVPPTFYGQLCQVGSKNGSALFDSCSSCLKDKDWMTNRDTFVHVLYLAGFLIGFGTGLFLTTGTLYIEAAKRQKDSPLQYGFLFFMNGLGEFLGSAFAWWFLVYPENLKAGSSLYPWSVRAWWLGMVIFSCLLFLLSWTFLFFPKWIVEPSWSIARRHARLARLTKLLDVAKRDRQKRREQMKRDKQRQKRGRNASAKGVASAKTGANASRSANVYVGDAANRGANGAAENEVPSSLTSDAGADGANSSDSETEETNGDALNSNGHSTIEEQSSQPPGRTPKGVRFGAVMDPSGADPVAPGPVGQKQRSPKAPRGPAEERKESQKRDKVSQVLTECFAAAWGLVSMPTYILAVVSATLSAYLPAGYRTDVARFVRTQYHYDLSSSIFYADGLCYSLAQAGGSLLGGYIVWKMRLSLPQQLRLIICALVINIFFFFLIFSVGCWSDGNRWQNSSAINSGVDERRCVKDCDCSGVQLQPVCSTGGASFISPCDAGCTSLQLRESNLVYSSCSCVVGGATVASEVSSAFCSTCSAFGGYWVLLFLSIVSYSTAYVSILLVFLRVVAEEKRQLSLSLAVWIIALGAYVPGTAVFRGIESSSCGKWSSDCHSESVCLIHDVNQLRYTIHGANIVFQGVALGGFVLILFFLKELNPCPKKSTSDQEHDLDPGQDRPRRTSTKKASASSGAILLGDGGRAVDGVFYQDSLVGTGSSSVVETNEDLHLPNSYVSPVFEMDDEMRGSWNPEESWAVENGLGRAEGLELTRTNGNVLEFDRLSGQSSL